MELLPLAEMRNKKPLKMVHDGQIGKQLLEIKVTNPDLLFIAIP